MPDTHSARADYGWDAPGVMLGLLGSGAGLIAAAGLAGRYGAGWVAGIPLLAGAVPLGLGLAMVAYRLVGKLRMRDRMLGRVPWTGRERVLDVGTGAGFLLAGAASRLMTGRAVGIDIWAAKDLSGNDQARTELNLVLAGVADRATVLTQDASALPFPDGSFDVVMSLLCLHNIEPAAARVRACHEIARVLAPGGLAILADYIPTGGYARELAAAGLRVERSEACLGTALSLMWWVVAVRDETPGDQASLD